MPRFGRQSFRSLDLIIKVVAAVAFIVPVWVGYFQWQRTALLETRKPYLDKQLEACLSLTDAAGTMATSPNAHDVVVATIAFDKLFWGRVALFDNGPIYKAGVTFRKAADERPRPDLRHLAEQIAHRCKDLVRASWDIR